ncbi:hypothetical protein GCM10009555_028450 [Acrocarpospora macrocephala]|uniref:Cysteine dioxygenase n=1 Tax=Acrocarpospora macrocephala TaxID=150177 RepID=A0A5M3X5E2_9ACTN|nr:hypothetical protein [Acrocarpospora macrocephala]GES15856.1 hypothetical protein Amac_094540 [Acrocarpospora macrocephala]
MRYSDLQLHIDEGTAPAALPRWAESVLRDIAAGHLPLTAVRHPLGFLCLPVERSGELGVCIHLWSPELASAASSTSQVHCHSWELTSFVLYGQIRNVLGDLREGTTHRIFEVVSHGDVDEIRASDRTVHYLPGRADVHRGGTTYSLPSGVFHSTEVGDSGEAATVVLGRTGGSRPDLSLGPPEVAGHTLPRSRCTSAETIQAARLAIARLTREPGGDGTWT